MWFGIGVIAFLVGSVALFLAVGSLLFKREKFGKWMKVFGVCALAFVVSALMDAGSVASKHDEGSAMAAAESVPDSAPKPDPVVEVSVYKLYGDYKDNEVAADSLYKGKRLAVKGQVDSVTKDFMGNVIVAMTTQNQFMPARGYISDSEVQKAAGLFGGQVVVLTCEGDGMIVGSPILRDCKIGV